MHRAIGKGGRSLDGWHRAEIAEACRCVSQALSSKYGGRPMAELQLTLTSDERDYLVNLLETTLKEARIEEHRTRAPSYREHVIEQENLVVSLLGKLGKPRT
jgi:hypothetical protein